MLTRRMTNLQNADLHLFRLLHTDMNEIVSFAIISAQTFELSLFAFQNLEGCFRSGAIRRLLRKKNADLRHGSFRTIV